MAKTIRIPIQIAYDGAGADNAKRALQALAQAVQQASKAPAGGGAAPALQQTAKAAQEAARAAHHYGARARVVLETLLA